MQDELEKMKLQRYLERNQNNFEADHVDELDTKFTTNPTGSNKDSGIEEPCSFEESQTFANEIHDCLNKISISCDAEDQNIYTNQDEEGDDEDCYVVPTFSNIPPYGMNANHAGLYGNIDSVDGPDGQIDHEYSLDKESSESIEDDIYSTPPSMLPVTELVEDDIYDAVPPRVTEDDIYDTPPPRTSMTEEDIYDAPSSRVSMAEDDIYDAPPPRSSRTEDNIYKASSPRVSMTEDDIYDAPRPRASMTEEDIYDAPSPTASMNNDDIYDALPYRASAIEEDIYDTPSSRTSMNMDDIYDAPPPRASMTENEKYPVVPPRSSMMDDEIYNTPPSRLSNSELNDHEIYDSLPARASMTEDEICDAPLQRRYADDNIEDDMYDAIPHRLNKPSANEYTEDEIYDSPPPRKSNTASENSSATNSQFSRSPAIYRKGSKAPIENNKFIKKHKNENAQQQEIYGYENEVEQTNSVYYDENKNFHENFLTPSGKPVTSSDDDAVTKPVPVPFKKPLPHTPSFGESSGNLVMRKPLPRTPSEGAGTLLDNCSEMCNNNRKSNSLDSRLCRGNVF